MTVYYLSPHGDNANNGLGPDASHATNKPWLTIAKAVQTTGMASGDTLYIAPGYYTGSGNMAIPFTMASPTAETLISGDPWNHQGFKDASGNLLQPGYVTFHSYTTDFHSFPASSWPYWNLNGADWLTIENILFLGSWDSGASRILQSIDSQHLTIRDCVLLPSKTSQSGIVLRATHGVRLDSVIERCIVHSGTDGGVGFEMDPGNVADWDVGCVIRNNLIISESASGIGINPTGGVNGTFRGGGVEVYHNWCVSRQIVRVGVLSWRYPVRVTNNIVLCSNAGVMSNALSAVIEDWNLLACNTPRQNTGQGFDSLQPTNSQVPLAPIFEFGQSFKWGFKPRMFFMPYKDSPWLNFQRTVHLETNAPSTAGNDASIGSVAWTNPDNAKVGDGSLAAPTYAQATNVPATTGVSNYLTLTGGLAVPANATLLSVRAEVVAYKASATNAIKFNSVKLIKGGVIGGNDLASVVSTFWPTTIAIASFGSKTDPFWGNSLSVSDVNAANFGVAIAVQNTAGAPQSADIDYVRLIVAYTLPDGEEPNTVDLLGRPRPSGSAKSDQPGVKFALGPLEYHDTAEQETSVVDAGAAALKIVGPGNHELKIPVDAVSTTLSIRVRYNASHGTANKPQVLLLGNAHIGVSAETKTAAAAADTWETLTFSAITPNAKGVVTLRLVSRAAAAAGIAYFDTLAVS